MFKKDFEKDIVGSELTYEDQQEIIFASSRRIKEEGVSHTQISDKKVIKKIGNIISKLPPPKERKIDDLIDFGTIPKKRVTYLLNGFHDNANEEKMEDLLDDFSDGMKTRMREERKYVVAILLKGELILCHSVFGEETITPDWKTIPRMLDSDNVLRYVRFVKENNIINVKYYERWATDSFVDWLGLPQKDAFFHFGGKYRIYSKIDGITMVFELTENEIDSWWDKHSEIRDGVIKFSTPIDSLTINQVRVGRKKYEDTGDFIQDFIAQKYGIEFYQKRFKEITFTSSEGRPKEKKRLGPLEPFLYKFYDERDRVIKVVEGENVVVVEKINPTVDILFVSRNIEIRDSYLGDILRRFINGEEINIIHAGLDVSPNPVAIGTMNILNKVKLNDLTNCMLDFYEKVNLQDRDIIRFVEFIIFKILANYNQSSHICYFFESFAQRIVRETSFGSKLTKLEDPSLEFKSQDYFSGGDADIIRKLSQDLTKKLSDSPCKIYLVGIEDGGTFNTIPRSRLKSDRVERIRLSIQNEIKTTVCLIPVIQNGTGILILVAGGSNGS